MYDQLFWRSQTFHTWAHLAAEWPGFEACHHPQHRDATLGQHFPWEVHNAHSRRYLASRFTRHRQGLPWREGRVSFRRLTDARGHIRFIRESFPVEATLMHKYVKGTLTTHAEYSHAISGGAGSSGIPTQ